MKAVRYHRYGGPEVLQVDEVPEPHPGPGQVRIRVQACGVNPWDVKGRAGRRSGGKPFKEPVIPGVEAAGVVDEVGPDVAGTAVGDAVFGFTVGGAAAEYALLRHWSHTPDTVSAVEAGGMSQVGETAARGLRELFAQREHPDAAAHALLDRMGEWRGYLYFLLLGRRLLASESSVGMARGSV